MSGKGTTEIPNRQEGLDNVKIFEEEIMSWN